MKEYYSYSETPMYSNARKAWLKFVEKWHEEPLSVGYTNAYDYQFKGWICEYNVTNPDIKYLGYAAHTLHDFYPSWELNEGGTIK